jgi:hypothetical protein
MKIVKRISIIFLCVVLLLISTSCFLDEWQWQRLYQDRHIAWCSNDDAYEYRKGKIKEIFEDYEKREWYRRYCFKVIEYDDEQKEYIDIGVKRFNCYIYLFESAQNLKERGLQIQIGDELYLKGILETSAGYAGFLVAEIWKDGVCYMTYEEGKATILECLKGAKSYPY